MSQHFMVSQLKPAHAWMEVGTLPGQGSVLPASVGDVSPLSLMMSTKPHPCFAWPQPGLHLFSCLFLAHDRRFY
jgi:hypothetical protein